MKTPIRPDYCDCGEKTLHTRLFDDAAVCGTCAEVYIYRPGVRGRLSDVFRIDCYVQTYRGSACAPFGGSV